jgi:thymidylate synthase ThyX
VITTGNTIKGLVSDSATAEVLALVFSSLAVILTVYGLSRNRERQIEQHRNAAHSLWLLRERYMHLIGDLRAGFLTAAEGRAQRDALTRASAHVYASALDTDVRAYKAAQRALKENEELTLSEKEIDCMLPPSLRNRPS